MIELRTKKVIIDDGKPEVTFQIRLNKELFPSLEISINEAQELLALLQKNFPHHD